MPKKIRIPQPQTPDKSQLRDFFQTPRYAVDLLIPYIPTTVSWIWEPAAGERRISNVLVLSGFKVFSTDLADLNKPTNFLTDNPAAIISEDMAIITNPPYSVLYKFCDRALEYDVPFAFLIPFHMSGKLAGLFEKGCQGLVPKTRINFLTPFVIDRINGLYDRNYGSVDAIPMEFLIEDSKRSTSQFHSFWLTYKFNLPSQLTFVELTKEDKNNI
jgi:hypothetical protein